MLVHRLRRWANVGQTLGRFVVFTGNIAATKKIFLYFYLLLVLSIMTMFMPHTGAPFTAKYYDSRSMTVTWEKIRLVSVGKAGVVELDPHCTPSAQVATRIIGEYIT